MKHFLKKFVFVLFIAILPVQGFAAIVTPLCQQASTTSASDAAEHSHPGAQDHSHDSSAPNHDHSLAAGDSGSDHCGTATVFAIPVIATTLPAASGSERSLFLATSVSGHVPEQPQRPPRHLLA